MKERQEKINWNLSKERNYFGMKEGKEDEKEQVTKRICSETGNGACAVLSSWLKSVHIFIHYAVCLATDPQPLESEMSGVSNVVLSVSNSSIIFLFYLRSPSSCLRRLPRIINPSIFPSMYKCWNKIKLWNYGKPIRGSNFQKGKETFLQVVGPTHKYGDYFPGDEAAGALGYSSPPSGEQGLENVTPTFTSPIWTATTLGSGGGGGAVVIFYEIIYCFTEGNVC
jgi:hypothetical protein